MGEWRPFSFFEESGTRVQVDAQGDVQTLRYAPPMEPPPDERWRRESAAQRVETAALTGTQERVLDALRDLTRDGWPATVRELGLRTGIRSPGQVHDALRALEAHRLAATNPRWPSRRGGWKPS